MAQPIALLLIPGFLGAAFHFISLYNNMFTQAGLQFGFFNAASTVGLIVSLITLLMSLTRQTEIMAVVVLPLTLLSIILEMVYQGNHILPPDTAMGLQIHVLVSIIAYSLLGLAALMSLVLAFQNRLLHSHHPGGILRRLPPLQILEKLLFDSIFAGFIGLTLALVTGFLFLEDLFAQHLVHKTVLSLVAWLVFGILLIGRLAMGWRGRKAIRWTLAGFFSLMLAYFGSKFVLEFLLVS
ncbi:MAG: cytochrome C assembly family protein [Gammaproteobacteria bacterium]